MPCKILLVPLEPDVFMLHSKRLSTFIIIFTNDNSYGKNGGVG